MGANSKASRALADVRLSLKSGKTRGRYARTLTDEETQALEQKRDRILAEMKEAAKERVVNRINKHTSAESDRVVTAVQQDGDATRASLQPLTSLVVGDHSTQALRHE